jgi:hypothetical protein
MWLVASLASETAVTVDIGLELVVRGAGLGGCEGG